MILSNAELVNLTKRERSDAQARELKHLGIPFTQRRDKSIVVFRSAVEKSPQATIREPELQP